MRIVFVADTFPPLRISGAVLMRDLVREFARQGHSPVVVVPTNPLDSSWKIEQWDGVTVLRCRTPPTKDVGYVRRTINEMRLPYVLMRAMRESGLSGEKCDGVVWYSPTIFLAPIVRALHRPSQCRTYLILMDIFPKWALDMGLMKRGPIYYFFKFVEARQYAIANTIGVQTIGSLPYFARWAKRPGRRVEVLQSWLADAPARGCPIDVNSTSLSGRKIFVYTGNMGVAQGLEIFLDVAARVRNLREAGFLFVGRGSATENLVAQAKARGLDNVLFQDEIDPDSIPGLLRQCHVGLVALDPKLNTHNIPGKFIAYAQAGLPVLARINPGNTLEHFIREEAIGKVSVSNDAAALETMVRELVSDDGQLVQMGARAKQVFKRCFMPAVAVRQIVAALSGAA